MPSSAISQTPEREAAETARLRGLYLDGLRRRFKAEVNRLTSGGMAALLGERPQAAELAFPLAYLYAWHWLRDQVAEPYRAPLLSAFRDPARRFLMDLLLEAERPEDFIEGYIHHWLQAPPGGPVQQAQLLRLLAAQGGDPVRLRDHLLAVWRSLGLFQVPTQAAYGLLAKAERQRYREMLDAHDRERLALVDALPDPAREAAGTPRFPKLGIVPAMGCPQTCRHCMFIWRPPRPKQADAERIYRTVEALTDSVLFTGGDLTRHLDTFYDGIRAMRRVTTFAILLNGDFAEDRAATEAVLGRMYEALAARPAGWPQARVLLQVSFDEFHQEVIVDRKGRLRERIPVAKIANIVECYPRYADRIQLALVHKQTALNFSRDVLYKGVFARLVQALGARGHRVEVLSMAPAPRLKTHPLTGQRGRVLKDASFVLHRYPEAPILLTSSTVDGYGRAALLDESETVKERELLHQVLTSGPPPGEAFDVDLMFWFNGWVTLFNAVHLCLGNLYEDGVEKILSRRRKDPLTWALHRFDRRLLKFYAEVRPDLDAKLARATGPHHLFHSLTEESAVRLHLTRRLLGVSR